MVRGLNNGDLLNSWDFFLQATCDQQPQYYPTFILRVFSDTFLTVAYLTFYGFEFGPESPVRNFLLKHLFQFWLQVGHTKVSKKITES